VNTSTFTGIFYTPISLRAASIVCMLGHTPIIFAAIQDREIEILEGIKGIIYILKDFLFLIIVN